MTAELRADRQGDCLVLRLHHPEAHNALTAAQCAALLEALTTAERDADIRAVVLTGSAQQFCSGLHERAALAPLHDCILALRDCAPLVVGAVEGLARGGGAALALACDLLVAADDAQMQLRDSLFPEVDVGGAHWLAARLMPRTAWLEAALLGVRATRLLQLGVATRLCAPGASLQTALQLVEAVASSAGMRRKPPVWDVVHAVTLHAHLDRQLQLPAAD
jgi:enoyl-CoA hydratase/carnithine racemase